MRTPATSAPAYLYLDPAERFILLNSFALPTLQIVSVANRVNDSAPVIQSTGSLQPVWAKSVLGGTFISTNLPETTGLSGLTYSGAQYLPYNSLSTVFSGSETPVAIVCQVAAASAGGTIWSLASSSASTPKLSLSYSGGVLSFTEVNGNGTFTTSTTLDTNVHVVSAVKVGSTISLRVDGAAVGSPTTITATSETYNTFTIGALNSNGSVSSQFNGTMGKVLVYGAPADIFAVEIELLIAVGIIRSASSGINQGGF